MTQSPFVVIAILLVAAVVGGMLAHRFRQPLILGYLLIGVAVGPHALGLVSDTATVETLATMGVALLMFTLGLETSFNQLRQIGRVGLLGGIIQVAATMGIGLFAGVVIFKWPVAQATLFGIIISMSSTAVCMKILMDRGELDSVHGRIMIAILIVQDVMVVALTVVVPLLGGNMDGILIALVQAFGKAMLFAAIALVSGLWVLPWIMGRIGGVRTRELFLLVVLALCIGAALGTQIFGLSSVFGAFLIGLVLHESKFAHHALSEITPLRDIFATLFFVSLGMLFDVTFLVKHWPEVLGVVGIIIVIKFGIVYGIVQLFGYQRRVSILTAAGLFQIGEFGFILAQAGLTSGVVTDQFYSLILASAITTMLLTALSMSLAGRFYRRLEWMPQIHTGHPLPPARTQATKDVSFRQIILAGYGRIGENTARGLEDAGIDFSIIDIDSERIDVARRMGRVCYHGDASNPAVLATAGVTKAKAMAITFPDPVAVINAARTARELNPNIKIVARVHREREAETLREISEVELVSPEYEASLEFVKRTLQSAGWHSQEIQRTMPVVEEDAKISRFSSDDEHDFR
jgi:monovalent cation:H+ antiporter-2, CPA2 family